MASSSYWADLDGPVHYVDYGGPDGADLLVCVHGLGGSHLNWDPVGSTLAATCRVIALDLPAHGATPRAGRSSSVRAVRLLLHRFLVEVVAEPAVLVGNSMGAMITIMQAAAAPETATGVVLLNPAVPHGVLSRPDPLVWAGFFAYAVPGLGERVLRERGARFTAEELVQQTLWLCCAHPERVPAEVVAASIELARQRTADSPAGFLEAARSLLWVLARPNVYEALLRAISAPVLLMHGTADRLIPVSAVRRVAARHRSWRVEIGADVGHVPQLEAAHWVSSTILDWLAEAGPLGRDHALRHSRP